MSQVATRISQKINNDDLLGAIGMLSAIPWFPPDEFARAGISEDLNELCSTRDELFWLIRQARRHMTQWTGVAALIQMLSSERERKRFEQDAAETDRKLIEWRQEKKLLAARETKQIAGEIEDLLEDIITGAVSGHAMNGAPPVETASGRELRRLSRGYPTPEVRSSRQIEQDLAKQPGRWLTEEEKRLRLEEIEQRLGPKR